MTDAARCLHQFRFSHFNEKARWALAYKGCDVARKNYLPGPHAGAIRKLSGQTQTPVLAWDGTIVSGSEAIIDFLEREVPEPALYPADRALQREALDVQAHFDAEVGPQVRRALFIETVGDGAYMARLFAGDRSWLARNVYGAMLPLVRPVMRKSMDLTPQANAGALLATEKALDFVGNAAASTGYIVGDQFSVADLTCASLLAITANPDHVDMKRPEPMPRSLSNWLERWQNHPGVEWVREIYRKHRSS